MCDFEAGKLLKERRELGTGIRPEAPHDENVRAYRRIKQIDALRHEHKERTGCDCWERARDEAAQQPKEAA